MCLACGYDGRIIQAGRSDPAWQCPQCGADLYARPPRSYAEMEGLEDLAPPTPGPSRVLPAPGMTVGYRSVAHIDRRRIVLKTPAFRRPAVCRWRSASVALFAVLAATLAATVLSIGIWLPGQF